MKFFRAAALLYAAYTDAAQKKPCVLEGLKATPEIVDTLDSGIFVQGVDMRKVRLSQRVRAQAISLQKDGVICLVAMGLAYFAGSLLAERAFGADEDAPTAPAAPASATAAPAPSPAPAAAAVLNAGERPANLEIPREPQLSVAFRRRMANGAVEECQSTRRFQNPGGRASVPRGGVVIDRCRPVVGSRPVLDASARRVCNWVDTELGVPVEVCSQPRTILNPESPFEACKYVELTESDSALAEAIRQRATIADACRTIGSPLPQASYLSQIIEHLPFYRPRATPELAETSHVGEVNSLLAFANAAGRQTQEFLDRAAIESENNLFCFEARKRAVWQAIDANQGVLRQEFPSLRGAAVEEAAMARFGDAVRSNLAAAAGARAQECSQLVTNTMREYQQRLPALRMQMLLAEGCCSMGPVSATQDWPTAFDPRKVINHRWREPEGVLTPRGARNASVGELGYSPVTDEEANRAVATFHSWGREIEREWEERTRSRNLPTLPRREGEVVQRQRYNPNIRFRAPDGRLVNLGNVQNEWEAFYRSRIAARRTEAREAIQREIVANPIFQSLASSQPTAAAWEAAFDALTQRNLDAQTRIQNSLNAARPELARYARQLADFRAGRGPRPSPPTVGNIRDVVVARGAIEAMVERDPALCSAAISYWNTVSRLDTADTFIEIGAVIGASLIGGPVGGRVLGGAAMAGRAGAMAPEAAAALRAAVTARSSAVIGTSVGAAGGGVVGWQDWQVQADRRDLGYNLLSACARFGEENCRTPGNIQRYLDDNFGATIAGLGFLIPGAIDGVMVRAAFAGSLAAGASYAGVRTPGFLRGGRVQADDVFRQRQNMEGLFGGAAGLSQFERQAYLNILGTETPSPAQKARADALLRGLYGEGRPGVLVATSYGPDAASREIYQRDFRVVAAMVRRIANDENFTPEVEARMLQALRLLQNPETGVAANPAHLGEVLEMVYRRILARRSPEDAVAVVREFNRWASEAGDPAALAGLARTDARALELAVRNWEQANRGEVFANLPPALRRQVMREIEANPATMERFTREAIESDLEAGYRGQGLTPEQASARARGESNDMLACQRRGGA